MTIVGIDLGTTNSLIGAVIDGEVKLFSDADGNELIPSVVGLDEQGQLLVGRPARNRRVIDPAGTIMSIKRRMGQVDPVTIGGHVLSPTQISALILGHLLDLAESELGARPDRAVITVPAYFDDVQRQATRDAGLLCGLTVERLVNEPTAAAMTYQTGSEENVLVYDLGGGTFDVSILERDEGFMEVRASRGDTQLGGDDLDGAFCDFLLTQIPESASAQVKADPRALARLSEAAERAKIGLSDSSSVNVIEPYLSGSGADAVHLDIALLRGAFEDVARPFLERTLASIDDALNEAKMSPDDLDRVLLVGGASRSPIVAEMVSEHLGRPAYAGLDADRAVVLGATRLAGRLSGEPIEEVLVDITPHTLCVGSLHPDYPYPEDDADLFASPVITRDSVVPMERTRTLYTSCEDQTKLSLPIGQGEFSRFGDNTFLGNLTVEGLPPSPNNSPVEVTFQLDISGVLHARAEHVPSGTSHSTRIVDSPTRLSSQQRRKAKAAIDALRSNAVPVAQVYVDPGSVQRAEAMKVRAEKTLAKNPEAPSGPVHAALAALDAELVAHGPDVEDRVDDLADALLDLL